MLPELKLYNLIKIQPNPPLTT